jgi:hypothetical protein
VTADQQLKLAGMRQRRRDQTRRTSGGCETEDLAEASKTRASIDRLARDPWRVEPISTAGSEAGRAVSIRTFTATSLAYGVEGQQS